MHKADRWDEARKLIAPVNMAQRHGQMHMQRREGRRDAWPKHPDTQEFGRGRHIKRH